ncbi:hypothetical protein L7F22_012315 [Adiantum nelumboides]|nr:hypothetical protein [Adiantum nelumboides]
MSAVLAKPQVKDFLKTLAKGKEKGQEQRKEHDMNAHAVTVEGEPSKKSWEEDIPELSSPSYSPPTSFSYSSDSSSSSNPRRRKKEKEGGKYKDTVDLPQTNFSLRANSVVREPEIQKMWEANKVLERVSEKNDGSTFILHDGPPYANGDLHIGHALNKILKDFINRFQLLQGRKVIFIPGWDCHGLPIELKVLQSMEPEARKELTPIKLRKKASQFALKTVEKQCRSFKRYGVWADWSNAYLTLNPEYEAAQIGVFGQMVLKGHIYRGKKPVHWSPSSRTALAEAELEYPDGHTSRSIYAAFKIVHVGDKFPENLKTFVPALGVAIWTTTPWTIPGNTAVSVNDNLLYAVVKVHHPLQTNSVEDGSSKVGASTKTKLGNGWHNPNLQYLVIALDLVEVLQSKWRVKLEVKGTLLGSALEHCRYIHPLFQRESPIVIGGKYITTESGTGLVHTAPGHGQEDFETGQRYGLPMLSPVDDEGIFTEEAGDFKGLSVLGEGNVAVVEALEKSTNLLMEEPYVHKYPYDWRTKKPTIFRATEQWFASVEGFKEAALSAIASVQWFPPQGENRITAMVSGRSDWCISRQRTWGVPIPVFYNIKDGGPLMNLKTISHIQEIIRQKGSDAWWYLGVEDLLPEEYKQEAEQYVKGSDTMDVWFDSGSSWAAVLGMRKNLKWPADVYLEGSDQHRGWFQSSLLTSVAVQGSAPFKKVLTHGFVLDEKGLKMSKSNNNGIDPQVVIEGGKNQKEAPGYGADVLRLWVASVDYTADVLIGEQILRQMSDIYRKLRGTLRFLLSNLHDFKPELDTVNYERLPMIDKYALFQLANVVDDIRESYECYHFYKFYQSIQRFAVVDLSNFYFDTAKDRLYVGGTKSFTRRSCQTVLVAHLLCVVRAIAPVLPHMAEDVWQHLPFTHSLRDGSRCHHVFEAGWPLTDAHWKSLLKDDIEYWRTLLQIRTEVNKVLEAARGGKLIGASLDAKVFLSTKNEALLARLAQHTREDPDKLCRIFITSQAEVLASVERAASLDIKYTGTSVLEGLGDLWVGVSKADGSKCERCWNYSVKVGSSVDHPTLCERCQEVIGHGVEVKCETAVAV